jgi:hypothetical protein
MQSLKFIRTNGNIPKKLAGEDHISGLVIYSAALPSGFSESERIKAVSTIETAEALGITADADNWDIRVLHYQLSEIFRVNPGISLYVGIFTNPEGANTYAEVKKMQNFADGRLRQLGVWDGRTPLAADNLTALQGVAATLEEQDMPLGIIYAPKVSAVASLPSNLAGDKERVWTVIGQAGSSTGAALYVDAENTEKASVSGLGVVLGIVSLAAVHESIAWIEKFPTGVDVPAFGDGTLLKTLDRAVVEALDKSRYLFFVTYSGLSGSYMNDSHTMDAPTSDYAYIENVRTMDKAVRGIRTYLLPKLGGNVYIDKTTGQLQTHSVEFLQTTAQKALEDMEKAGELSGYVVEIDPDQNVLSTSEIEFVIRPVGAGVVRRFKVKIGFAESV